MINVTKARIAATVEMLKNPETRKKYNWEAVYALLTIVGSFLTSVAAMQEQLPWISPALQHVIPYVGLLTLVVGALKAAQALPLFVVEPPADSPSE